MNIEITKECVFLIFNKNVLRVFTETYMSRVRRGALDGTLLREHLAGGRYQGEMDVANVEHQLVAEMGPDVCLFEDICNRYSSHKKPLDWEDVVRYKFHIFVFL
jgi:hypothetical protein